MRVDFPAPFSPRRPSISPRPSRREIRSLALTGPNVLVMSRISRTAGASAAPAVPSGLALSVTRSLVDGVGDLDLAVDDVLAGLVHGVLYLLGDVVVEAPVGGQGDALLLRAAVDRGAARLAALGGLLYRLADGHIHALDNARQDRGLLEALGLLRGGLEEAAARVAGGVVDHVRALLYLLLADLLASARVVEGLGTGPRVLGDDLAVRAHRLDPGLVAGLELLDQRPLEPAQN